MGAVIDLAFAGYWPIIRFAAPQTSRFSFPEKHPPPRQGEDAARKTTTAQRPRGATIDRPKIAVVGHLATGVKADPACSPVA